MTPFLSVLTSVVAWVVAMLVVASVAVIGPARLRETWSGLRDRLWDARRAVAVVCAVLIASAVGRPPLLDVSRLFGLQATAFIYGLEGGFVAWVQATFATPALTAYFSWVYVYGYAFLLAFPPVAYLALPRTTTFSRVLVAYALNYGIGLVLYTAVFAHGPRNVMPDMVTPLLFTTQPDVMALTSEVNVNSNVFPSLHTSLSVTVGTFAVLTHEEYPRWTPVAVPLSLSVVVATMYLGIHWLTDVVAGFALAFGSVALAYRLVEPRSDPGVPRDGPEDDQPPSEPNASD
ncbi:phosphatase PAP2 family protein [Halorubrum ezzemoulense]|jgi:membrane-associated phospholipid phosphatase|uniref:Inositol phosphorylceramide synthase n=2 Tax=Halorubrum ezzemoulense TaxID=337243 RepID=A0A256J9U7_HALEZ|nr:MULTISPECIES: phosphatase PAP2 family protein [Halorubrum]MDB2242215.1 phosphatase PAP2 family protein [Halorubrum ezzemoulense]MDB2245999.1 phosphatase PAP2 family protein [Halorubrum ezzemoulense]MDB2252786.1 phosphatase PAP2 family protein [Halorubrum ezzemoulense]MDB2261445.1 phosphatase PAP2 family protein [Halorubrum ezzemoulense]MDB2264431.1 phosphatase PAP2 family protein [Halorubrum ezzemoulense]